MQCNPFWPQIGHDNFISKKRSDICFLGLSHTEKGFWSIPEVCKKIVHKMRSIILQMAITENFYLCISTKKSYHLNLICMLDTSLYK